jgi:hypothetical protein
LTQTLRHYNHNGSFSEFIFEKLLTILKMEGKSNRKMKKNEHWLPKQPQRSHLEENTLTEITVGKEQASDTDESKKMLHLEQNSVENDRGSNNPGRPVIFKVGIYCIAIIIFGSDKM